jgi:DNA-binding GntR family transcriptional regulator
MENSSVTNADIMNMPSKSLVEQIREQVLDRILTGQMKPNQAIQERPLSVELGVSRTPLREALRQLEGERYVGRREDGTLIVQGVTVQEILEVLRVRSLLEADAARAACGQLSADALLGLRQRLIAVRDSEQPDMAEHKLIDEELHSLIAQAGGGPLMQSIIAELKVRTRMFSMQRIPSRFKPVCEEHLALIDALLAEDAQKAEAASQKHIYNIRESIIQWLQRG